jgi:CRISPR/Cas system-associated exonuclease Cas4 (RecB family)
MAIGTLSILSQSSLQDYSDCPRRFKLRHIDRLNYPALESEPAMENEKNQLEGLYFHRLAQQALLGMDPVKLKRLAGSPDLMRWWQNFVDYRPALDGQTLYTEFTLTAPLGSLQLVAKYDVIAVCEGHALILDWKTYRRRPTDAELAARWQTRVYPALLAHAGRLLNAGQDFPPEEIHMLYWFADFPAEPASFPYSVAQFQRDWDALTRLAAEIPSMVDFAQTDDVRKCGYCVYRSYCERGIRAAEGLSSEVEVLGSSLVELNFEQIAEIAF